MREGPIVVGGTGGSGTRAVALFLVACGVDMGRNLNAALDAKAFASVLERSIGEMLTGSADKAAVISELRQAASEHRIEKPGRWGFKNPRLMLLLPLLVEAFPGMSFVHVIRDGRDMLLSGNKRQPRKHYESLFGRSFNGSQEDIARFWAHTNTEANTFGLSMGDRYVIVRIEDMVGASSGGPQVLAATLGLDLVRAEKAAVIFESRETFGRGRRTEISGVALREMAGALRLFGYGVGG